MDLLQGLNQPQQQAVTAQPGPIMIVAGPGSGKTQVLTKRIVYLIQALGVAPWHIMAVTFTNKAAKEMRHRIEKLLGEPPRGLMMGTFHSMCAGILRREAEHLTPYTREFAIFDTDDQKQVAKQALEDLNLDDKKFPPAKMLSYVSNAKNDFITPNDYVATNHIAQITRQFYQRYQELLRANNAMDFDDLLMNTLLLFDQNPAVLQKYQQRFQHILVDEFQDTNITQYGLLQRLAAAHQQIFVVGDGDQSIYRWRGADVRNINRFRQQYPHAQTILLEQNYRSTQTILDVATAVINNNPNRIHKKLFTEGKKGGKIIIREAYDEREEAGLVVDTIAQLVREGYEPGDFAVMYRTNAQSRALEEGFITRGLPYKLVGATRFYGRKEIKDLIAYLRLIHNLADSVSFQRVINTPTRNIGGKTQEQLLVWAAQNGWQPGQAVIKLATEPQIQHPFNARTSNALVSFGRMLHNWLILKEEVTVGELLDRVLEEVKFRPYLDDGSEEGADRWANVLELRNVAQQAQASLTQFLEEVALVSEVDNLQEGSNAPTLLTLHAAKGLEFPIVFITGLEEGILPHSRSVESLEELEEERRLFYVGITRAKEHLFLFYAFRRASYGQSEVGQRSGFLFEIPGELVEGGNSHKRQPRQIAAQDWRWERQPLTSSRSQPMGSSQPPTTSWTVPATNSSSSATTPSFRTGQRVRHGTFGEGFVVEVKVGRGDTEVVVAFPSAGLKRLSAGTTHLEII